MDFKTNCKKCPKYTHCCIFNEKLGFTFVTPKDAKLIRKRINKEYSYFLDYSPIPKKIARYLRYEDPLLEGGLRFSQLDKKNRILRLRIKKGGTCIFLNKQKQCDIYYIRPNICRIFPFWAINLTNGKIKVITHDFQSKCKIIRSLGKGQEDIDETLNGNEKNKIKKIFKKVKNENILYRKEMKNFLREKL